MTEAETYSCNQRKVHITISRDVTLTSRLAVKPIDLKKGDWIEGIEIAPPGFAPHYFVEIPASAGAHKGSAGAKTVGVQIPADAIANIDHGEES